MRLLSTRVVASVAPALAQPEPYYRHKLNGAVELTPDFQYIHRPGGDRAAEPVKVIGLRAKVGI